jgi:hypothetical protein
VVVDKGINEIRLVILGDLLKRQTDNSAQIIVIMWARVISNKDVLFKRVFTKSDVGLDTVGMQVTIQIAYSNMIIHLHTLFTWELSLGLTYHFLALYEEVRGPSVNSQFIRKVIDCQIESKASLSRL